MQVSGHFIRGSSNHRFCYPLDRMVEVEVQVQEVFWNQFPTPL